jgi:hypothetical protein
VSDILQGKHRNNNSLPDPLDLKILVFLDKVGVLTSKRIAEILNISRDGPPVEQKMEQLKRLGLVRVAGRKSFGVKRAINLWEPTEDGKMFIANTEKNNTLPRIKLSEMSGEVKNICSEILNFLELPKSIEELDMNLKTASIKMRKYKLGDLLRVLEAAKLIKRTQVRKEVKVLERIDVTEISDIPGGIVTYIKTEGADINSAEI